MKRIPVLICLIVLFAGVTANAQPRIDIGIDVPFYFGMTLPGGDDVGSFSDFTFLFPEITGSYVFNLGFINIGVGVRMFTFIVETFGWPNAFVELNLGPMVLSAQIGGGLLFAFGLANTVETGPIVVGDLTAAFTVTEWFRLGIGVLTIAEVDEDIAFSDEGTFPFVVYAFAKFPISLGPKAE